MRLFSLIFFTYEAMSATAALKRNRSLLESTKEVEEMQILRNLKDALKSAKSAGLSPFSSLHSAAKLAMLESMLDSVCKVEGNYYQVETQEEEEEQQQGEGNVSSSVVNTDKPSFVSTSRGMDYMLETHGDCTKFCIRLYNVSDGILENKKCRGRAEIDLAENDLWEFIRYVTGEMESHADEGVFYAEAVDSRGI